MTCAKFACSREAAWIVTYQKKDANVPTEKPTCEKHLAELLNKRDWTEVRRP